MCECALARRLRRQARLSLRDQQVHTRPCLRNALAHLKADEFRHEPAADVLECSLVNMVVGEPIRIPRPVQVIDGARLCDENGARAAVASYEFISGIPLR